VASYTFTTSKTRRRSPQFRTLRDKLISVAGLVGQNVVNQEGQSLGTVVDLVFRWDTTEPYPPLAGAIIRVSRRRVFVTADNIGKVTASQMDLSASKIDLREFRSRNGEVRLIQEVLDHQLIDVDGARVVRASDLYIAQLGGQVRLVGVEVGIRSLFRRLGPRKLRTKPVPEQVIDWATVQSFGGQGTRSDLTLSARRGELRRLRPGELADLLEDLGRDERRELLTVLPAEQAADAIEEMEPSEVEAILRESTQKEAAVFLSNMEPDEAADALRDMDEDTREQLIARMKRDSAKKVENVLAYDETLAGGSMNTDVYIAKGSETVESIRNRLEREGPDLKEIESIAVVDDTGVLLYDLSILDLIVVSPKIKLRTLIKPTELVTVAPGATMEEVAEYLIESRRSSILVVDDDMKPMGRIFADDVIDALLPNRSSLRFPRLLS
jgi:hypothetical protein